MASKNITVKIDEETYNKARVRAAEKGTSVSAMVRKFLQTDGEKTAQDPHAKRVAALQELYRKADRRAKARNSPLTPLTRDEIYEERIH